MGKQSDGGDEEDIDDGEASTDMESIQQRAETTPVTLTLTSNKPRFNLCYFLSR